MPASSFECWVTQLPGSIGSDEGLKEFGEACEDIRQAIDCSVFRSHDPANWTFGYGESTGYSVSYQVCSDDKFCACEGEESVVFVAPVPAGTIDEDLTFDVIMNARSDQCN